MQEVLFLFVLMLAVACGWLLGRRQGFRPPLKATKNLPDAYFRGLKLLLNEQPKQAMDFFIQALDDDSEAIDTHLTLGKLFRTKGDLSKATRVHQDLLARPDLGNAQRMAIQFELACDYMAAGLLDRAERLFSELVESGDEIREKSLLMLLDIYQREKDWQRAIGVSKNLLAVKTENMALVIAQYYCELAQQYLHGRQENEARHALVKALGYDSSCARVYLLLAEIDVQYHDYKAAIKNLKQVKKQSVDYLVAVLPMLRDCYHQLGEQNKFYQYLLECLHDGSLINSGFNGSQTMRKHSGDPHQLNLIVRDEVRRAPSLHGLRYLLDLKMYDAMGEEIPYLQELRGFVEQLIAKKSAYCCKHCGYTSKQLAWHCPSCQRWGAIKPSHIVE